MPPSAKPVSSPSSPKPCHHREQTVRRNLCHQPSQRTSAAGDPWQPALTWAAAGMLPQPTNCRAQSDQIYPICWSRVCISLISACCALMIFWAS